MINPQEIICCHYPRKREMHEEVQDKETGKWTMQDRSDMYCDRCRTAWAVDAKPPHVVIAYLEP